MKTARTEKAMLAVKRKRGTKLNQSRKPEYRWLMDPVALEQSCYVVYPWAGVRRLAKDRTDEFRRL